MTSLASPQTATPEELDVPDAPVSLTLTAFAGIPLVHSGDDLVALILQSLQQTSIKLEDGDILVIAQKIVSKSEGRYVRGVPSTSARTSTSMWSATAMVSSWPHGRQ